MKILIVYLHVREELELDTENSKPYRLGGGRGFNVSGTSLIFKKRSD